MIAVLIVPLVAMYLVMVGVVYSKTADHLDVDGMDGPGPSFAGLFWPITLPVALGIYMARAPRRQWAAAQEKARKMMEDVEAAKARTAELEKDCEIVDPLVALVPKPDLPSSSLGGAKEPVPVPNLPSPYSRGGMPRASKPPLAYSRGAGMTRRL